ncbi:MAG: alpha/beta hydrolase [Desulfobacterales bacterium]
MNPKPSIHYEVHGVTGTYLLLVHGMLSGRAQWIPNLEALCSCCRPVVVELFGHGRSPSPEDPKCYTLNYYSAEFERIRNELSIEKWFVCGQSLGAALTLNYALNHSEQVMAQIFTNSRSALTDESMDETMEFIANLIKEKGREVIDDFPLHPSKNKRLSPEIKSALIEDVNRVDINGFSHTCLYTVAGSSLRHLIHKNSVPTLLIAGKFDRQFMPLIDFAKTNFPNLELLVLDGGHAVNLDVPDRFNQAVMEYMGRFDKNF